MKIRLLILSLFLSFNIMAQSGGSGNCHVTVNPNTLTDLEVQDLVSDCQVVINTTTSEEWHYYASLTQGTRWVKIEEIPSGGLNGQILSRDVNGDLVWINSQSGADNLGDHTATQNIQTNGNWISSDGDDEGIFVGVNGNVGILTSNPQYPIKVGDSGLNSTSDIQIGVSRETDATIESNAHAFHDGTTFVRDSSGYAYNSFNTYATIGETGTNTDYNHFAAYQTGNKYKGSGILGTYVGLSTSLSIKNDGLVDNFIGLRINNVTAPSTGYVNEFYGIFVEKQSNINGLYHNFHARGGLMWLSNPENEATGDDEVFVIERYKDRGGGSIRVYREDSNNWGWIMGQPQRYSSGIDNTLVINNKLGRIGLKVNAPQYEIDVNGQGNFTGTVKGADPIDLNDFVTKQYLEANTQNPTIGTGTSFAYNKYGGSATLPLTISDGQHYFIENTNNVLNSITVTADGTNTFQNGSILGGSPSIDLIPGEVVELVKDETTSTYRVASRWLGEPFQVASNATLGQTVINVGKFKDYSTSLFALYINGQKYNADGLTGSKITAYDGDAGTVTVVALALDDIIEFKGIIR